MTDVKRIQELILTVGQRAALGSPLHEDEAEAVNAALSELARIKGAALSAPEIEARHTNDSDEFLIEQPRREVAALHTDRATLLDALRLTSVMCDEAQAEAATSISERDESRAQLAQAQKEIERLLDCKRPGTLVEPGCGQCVACLRGLYQDANDRAEERRDAAKKSRHLEEQLAQAERDKAAMRAKVEGLMRVDMVGEVYGLRIGFDPNGEYLERSEVLALFDTPRDHGALVPQEGERQKDKTRLDGDEKAEPSKPRLLPCSVCGTATEWRCADCRLRLGVPVAVCNSRGCQDRHEQDERSGAEILAAHRDAKTGPSK